MEHTTSTTTLDELCARIAWERLRDTGYVAAAKHALPAVQEALARPGHVRNIVGAALAFAIEQTLGDALQAAGYLVDPANGPDEDVAEGIERVLGPVFAVERTAEGIVVGGAQ